MELNSTGSFRRYSLSAACALLGTAGLVITSPANAQECANRGTLDAMYCDADGDLVADAPTDPAKLVNPDTLVFAYTPVEDPAIYEDIWEPFIAHLEKVTGKKVSFFAVQSTGDLVEGSRARLCGVVTGRYSYSNTGNGTTHAVKVVGVFDLAENRSAGTSAPARRRARALKCADQSIERQYSSETAPGFLSVDVATLEAAGYKICPRSR